VNNYFTINISGQDVDVLHGYPGAPPFKKTEAVDDPGSSDITINLSNKDAGDEFILMFQKPTNLNEIFKTLFPTAWKVIPLGNGGSQQVTYPMALQVTVKEYQATYDATQRGTTMDTPQGQLWHFINRGSFNVLEKIDGQTVDGLVGCRNDAAQLLDMGVSKNGTPLVVKRQVGEGDQAVFQLTPKIYVAYASDLQEGGLISSDVSSATLFELDLTNLKSIDLELSEPDPTTGKKVWTASNRVASGS
jgi:hypothetical protein